MKLEHEERVMNKYGRGRLGVTQWAHAIPGLAILLMPVI